MFQVPCFKNLARCYCPRTLHIESCSRLKVPELCGTHSPSIAGRTDAASFAGEGDKEITTAIRAVGTGEAIGEDTAFQVASEVPLDIGRHRMSVPIAFMRQHQVGLQMVLDDAVEDGLLRTATGVRNRSTSPDSAAIAVGFLRITVFINSITDQQCSVGYRRFMA